MDKYKIYDELTTISYDIDFVEDLSTWYLRRCRDRFKDENDAILVTKNLLIILINLSKVIAPFTPFMSDEIYLFVRDFANISNIKESVHLEDWPKVKNLSDQSVLENMLKTRQIIEQGLALRNKLAIKVRQPLLSISIKKDDIDNIYVENIELDTNITEDLRLEGVVRDIIREIQSKRKDLQLIPSDKIDLTIKTKDDIESYADFIKETVNSGKINIINSDTEEIVVNKI